MVYVGSLLLAVCIATGLVPAIKGAADGVFDGSKDTTHYVLTSGTAKGEMMTYEAAEKKCLQLKGSVAHLEGDKSAQFLSSTVFKAFDAAIKLWVFKGAILDKSNVLKDTYNECYVFDNKKVEVSQEPCDKEHYVLCEVPREKTCDVDFPLYFNGSCYKLQNGPPAMEGTMEKACQKSGAHLASVHSEEENRILFRQHDACKGNETEVLAYIGASATGVDGQSFHGKNTDDSAFDFGKPTDANGAPIKGQYPWCPDYPAFLSKKKYPALISDNAFNWSGYGCWKFFNQPVRCSVCKKPVQKNLLGMAKKHILLFKVASTVD